MVSVSVPRYCYKYYRSGSPLEFAEAGLATEDELNQLIEVGKNVAEALNLKLLGWAFAKDQYIDKFAESGSGFVAIVQDDSHKYLLNIFNGSNPTELTREFLDELAK